MSAADLKSPTLVRSSVNASVPNGARLMEERSPMHNPYTPPISAEVREELPQVKRTLAVWIFLVIFGIFLCIFATGLGNTMMHLVSHLPEDRDYLTFSLGLLVSIALLALGLSILIGVYRRRQWSRWMGVLAILALLFLMFQLPDTTRYANSAERAGGTFGRQVLFPVLLVFWAYRFGFSAKAKLYFGKKPKSDA